MKILITGGNGNIARIIKNNLNKEYLITTPGRDELDLLNFENLKNYLKKNIFDVCIHTAIRGGRRIKSEDYDIYYLNLLMFENLMMFSSNFKMILNMDSGAIYDRETDILNRKEENLLSVPKDFYGFSKYTIYNRSLNHTNLYNYRIFNIFHPNEESDRFTKLCLNKEDITINEDKYFDFVYYLDFVKIVEYYINNIDNQSILDKVINISYKEKYQLSTIAKLINPNINTIIINKISNYNYSGNSEKLDKLKLNFLGLEKSIVHYKSFLK
jgi:GDP-L-fucose synthase